MRKKIAAAFRVTVDARDVIRYTGDGAGPEYTCDLCRQSAHEAEEIKHTASCPAGAVLKKNRPRPKYGSVQISCRDDALRKKLELVILAAVRERLGTRSTAQEPIRTKQTVLIGVSVDSVD